jgi:hypothetical protein
VLSVARTIVLLEPRVELMIVVGADRLMESKPPAKLIAPLVTIETAEPLIVPPPVAPAVKVPLIV